MFERVKNIFRKGGAKLGMVEKLNKITDHHKIGITSDEYERIQKNKRFYSNSFPDVSYLSSTGQFVKRPYHSINVTKIMAREMSKIVYNEGCDIHIDNEGANDFLQDVLGKSKFRKNFGEALEEGYAISGIALRPYYDKSTKTIKIAFCQPDCFYPLNTNTNDITEAAIATATQQTEGQKTIYYTLLEFHEWEDGIYVVTNELYRSEKSSEVGIKVPLNSLEKYEDMEPRVVLKASRPMFVYIKLAGKNNLNLTSPLGLGVADNARIQLKDINDKYDEFMREIEEASRKIVAPDSFFKTSYDENGNPTTYFDHKTSVYQKLRTNDSEMAIQEFTPSLRSSEFIESINFILKIAENIVGFSPGTFSFDGQSVKTATEIVSENTKTFRTRTDNVQLLEEALKELVITIFDLARLYGLYGESNDFEISVDFDDGVFESKDAKLEYYGKAVTYQIMPKFEAMKRQFGLSDEDAEKWLKQLDKETTGIDPDEQQKKSEQSLLGPTEN